MDGTTFISPASFVGSLADSLPIFLPPPPLAGATADWDARGLSGNAGSLVTSWPSRIAGGPTLTVTGSPGHTGPTAPSLVARPDGSMAVLFDGINNTLGAAMPRGYPNTVVAIGRMLTYPAGELNAIVGSGSNNSNLGQMLAVLATGRPRLYAGTSLDMDLSVNAATGYHVFMGGFNGATDSFIRMDSLETVGGTQSPTSSVISLAAYAPAVYANVEIQRVLYYPFLMSSQQRVDVTAALRAEHGI